MPKHDLCTSAFGLRHSFGIRHSTLALPLTTPLIPGRNDRDILDASDAGAGFHLEGVVAWTEDAGFPDDHAGGRILARYRHSLEFLAFDTFQAGGQLQGQCLVRHRVIHISGDRESFLRLERSAQGEGNDAVVLWTAGVAAAIAPDEFLLGLGL